MPTIEEAERVGRELVLQKLHYYAVDKRDRSVVLADARSFRMVMSQIADHLISQLVAYVWAEQVQLEEVTVIVEVPRTWLDHLRADLRVWALNHAPRWMPNRLRYVMQTLRVEHTDVEAQVRFEHYVKYPEFAPPSYTEDRRHLGLAVSEVRTNGARRRKVRVFGWWKED